MAEQLVTVEDVASLDRKIPAAWAKLYVDAVNSIISEMAGPDATIRAEVLPQIRLLIVKAIIRAARNKPWVKREVIGPYATDYRDVVEGLFTLSELATLSKLLQLPEPLSRVAGPRCSFPAAGAYDQLFVTPPPPAVRLAFEEPGYYPEAGVVVLQPVTAPTGAPTVPTTRIPVDGYFE